MVRRVKRIRISSSKPVLYFIIIAVSAFTLLPIIYTVSTSFKPMDELFLFPPRFIVRNPTFANFENLVASLNSQTVPFTRFIANSLVTTLVTVLATVVVCSMGAYAVAKLKPRGSKLFASMIIAALMFSGHVTLIPTYMIVNYMGLVDTLASLIIPKIAVAYNFFLMQQFITQIPNEILESSRMDGANEMRVFWQIVMPNLKPAWSTLVVLSFVVNWNDYFTPLIFISSQQLKTMPVALQTLGSSIAMAGAVAAASCIMIIPTIVLYAVMQKKVAETMMYSGIKG